MTREQIAELRKHAEMQEECIDGKACAHMDELLQLIDEREALLVAAQFLRAVDGPCNDDVGTGCETGSWCDAHSEARNKILAALARAEAP